MRQRKNNLIVIFACVLMIVVVFVMKHFGPEKEQKHITDFFPEWPITANAAEKQLAINRSGNVVYIYQDSSKQALAGALQKDGAAYIVGTENGLYKVTSGSIKGYIDPEGMIKGSEAVEYVMNNCKKNAKIKEKTCMVFNQKNLGGQIVTLLSTNDLPEVLEIGSDYVKIVTKDNIEGYIALSSAEPVPQLCWADDSEPDLAVYYDSHEDELATYGSDNEYDKMIYGSPNKTEYPTYTVSGDLLVNWALQFVGNPYVWGGESLTDGIDCSGFIMKVYEHFGYSLPHSSVELRSVGRLVCTRYDLNALQLGDIICYEGHVALYIGNGEIVHAANKHDGIKTSKADYRSDIICVRRLLENSIAFQPDEMDLLYRVVQAEAGNQGETGIRMVVDVIRNRMLQSNASLVSVLLRPGQFQCVSNGSYLTVNVSDSTKTYVDQALRSADITGGSTYYMNPVLADPDNVIWFRTNLEYVCTYKDHEFYKKGE